MTEEFNLSEKIHPNWSGDSFNLEDVKEAVLLLKELYERWHNHCNSHKRAFLKQVDKLFGEKLK